MARAHDFARCGRGRSGLHLPRAAAIIELIANGVPRSRRAIVAELASRHDKLDVTRTFMRLAVTGQVVEAGSKYVIASIELNQA